MNKSEISLMLLSEKAKLENEAIALDRKIMELMQSLQEAQARQHEIRGAYNQLDKLIRLNNEEEGDDKAKTNKETAESKEDTVEVNKD